MTTFRVVATSLHLRSQPMVAPATKIALLPQGQLVEKLAVADPEPWWKVATAINGVKLEGYVNSAYLQPVDVANEPAVVDTLTPVHLATQKSITRAAAGGRAFPLNEAGQPRRKATTPTGKVAELQQIINWLKVDESARYKPKPGETYCNIYAYDYCYLANVYLPRVWWTRKAIALISAGTPVQPVYDSTVSELNANSLHNWFNEFGTDFGWRRSFVVDEVQARANEGAVCILSARRKDQNRPGHICAVVPETDTNPATRKNGAVTIPVQSQAGATNFRYGGSIWWTSDKFDSFSFWIHA